MLELLGTALLGALAVAIAAVVYNGYQEKKQLQVVNAALLNRVVIAETQYALGRADLAEFLAKPVLAQFSDEQVQALINAVTSRIQAAPLSRVN